MSCQAEITGTLPAYAVGALSTTGVRVVVHDVSPGANDVEVMVPVAGGHAIDLFMFNDTGSDLADGATLDSNALPTGWVYGAVGYNAPADIGGSAAAFYDPEPIVGNGDILVFPTVGATVIYRGQVLPLTIQPLTV